MFKALADPTRRSLLDELFRDDGQTLHELEARFPMTRFGVMKHLKQLEEAGLVVTKRRGREKLHFLNPVPIRLVHDRWVSKYAEPWAAGLSGLKQELERHMEKVFEIYIKTTPERLWEALTNPAFTSRWWQTTFDTDWAVGSTMIWDNNGVIIEDPDQVVLEAEPFSRLSYTWHTFSPEMRERFDDEVFDKLSSERRSRATFELEPVGDQVKLTVIHDDFEPGSLAATMVRNGWPIFLSSLKTLLETGEPLPSTR